VIRRTADQLRIARLTTACLFLGGVRVSLGDFVAIKDAIAERWHETSVSDQSTGLWGSLPTRTVSSLGIEIPGALRQGRLLLIQPTGRSAR
jgi:hypothetical protein